jgi:hypothetical protein
MSAAVGANLSGKSGANEGCAFLYNSQDKLTAGFACYLEYVDATDPDADLQTGVVDVYFNADGNGKHIHPISATTYNNETVGSSSPSSLTPTTAGGGATSRSPSGSASTSTTTSQRATIPTATSPATTTGSSTATLTPTNGVGTTSTATRASGSCLPGEYPLKVPASTLPPAEVDGGCFKP